jgi:flagellar protein FliL
MAAKSEPNTNKGDGLISMLVAGGLALSVGLGTGFGAIMFLAPTTVQPVKPATSGSQSQNEPSDASQTENGRPGKEKTGDVQDSEIAAAEADAVDPADIDFAPIPPVIVNLLEPKQVWLRMEGGIAYSKSGEKKTELLAAEAAQQIAQYLKTLRLADIEGPDGLQFLQEEINATVHALSDGQVKRVLLTGLIVE